MNRIYLDYASVAPLRPCAREAMSRWLHGAWNTNAVHHEGRAARAALDQARDDIAAVLGVAPRNLVFTAGGSEAITLALQGIADTYSTPGTVIAAASEHAAVLANVAHLTQRGWCARMVALDDAGRWQLPDLQQALIAAQPGPVIVACMYIQNEIGVEQPIEQIGLLCREYTAHFVCDAVAIGAATDTAVLGRATDAFILAGQKLGGPLGAAVLVRPRGLAIMPSIRGGSQEFGLRAGTSNLPAITGFAAALSERARLLPDVTPQQQSLQRRFEARLGELLPPWSLRITAAQAARSPSLSHLAFRDLDGPALLAALDLAGLAVSAGSACAAGIVDRSPVASAIGLESVWSALVRCSWGSDTTEAEIDDAADRIARAVRRLHEVPAAER